MFFKYRTLCSVLLFCVIGSVLCEVDVSQKCLGCICEASSGCNTKRGCIDDNCGPFNIIRPYWDDAGRPNLDGPSDDPNAYQKCTKDITCAAITVQGYMNAYATDCNGDGVINCDDFILLHWFGGGSCNGQQLPPNEDFTKRYLQCKKTIKL